MKFINPSGLDINGETEASNFGDAISVARLINIFYRKDSSAMEKTTHNKVGEFTNTNEYADILPFLSGSKTGFTDVAGGNLVTLFDILDNRIAIVVLGSTKEDRFKDTEALLKSYFLNYK
jgi:D-alanyl-D-alanine carboxypeptidase